MIVGYARVSTDKQDLNMQIDALEKYGVDKIYTEKISGASKKRPVFQSMLTELKSGDTLSTYKLDRISRSTFELLDVVQYCEKHGIDLVSLNDDIDTKTPQGKFFFTIMSALSEMERNIIRQRTLDGLEAARARGRVGGRPKVSQEKVEYALLLYKEGNHSIKYICEKSKISRSTLYRIIKEHKLNESEGTYNE